MSCLHNILISYVRRKFVTLVTNNNLHLYARVVEKMEEVEGFEPPRDLTPLSVFKTDPFSQTWVFLRVNKI